MIYIDVQRNWRRPERQRVPINEGAARWLADIATAAAVHDQIREITRPRVTLATYIDQLAALVPPRPVVLDGTSYSGLWDVGTDYYEYVHRRLLWLVTQGLPLSEATETISDDPLPLGPTQARIRAEQQPYEEARWREIVGDGRTGS